MVFKVNEIEHIYEEAICVETRACNEVPIQIKLGLGKSGWVLL